MLIAQATQAATQPAAGAAPITSAWWWTALVQGVNFIVLVLLLWRFLFRRVIQAMDRREKKIASHFESAEQSDREAKEKLAAVETERVELQTNRDAMLKSAADDAAKQRLKLEAEGREIVEREAAQWHEDLQREKQAFLQQMQTMAGEQVCEIARRALADLADAELESRIVDVLIKRLPDVPQKDRDALKKATPPLKIATAFELAESDREKIAKAVGEHIRSDAEVEFETAPELTCGIELRGGGHEIGWTVEGYIRGIHESLAAAIDEKTRAAAPRAKPEKTKKKKKKASKRKRPTRKKAKQKSDTDE